jgi:transposase-like protein
VPRAYKSYTEAERFTILATAVAEQLSATEVQRRFGVKPVTYYSWRKKCCLKSTHGLRGQRGSVSLQATRSQNGNP